MKELTEEQIISLIETQLVKNLETAATHLETKVKERLSKADYTGNDPSAPGQPPDKTSGHLKDSISHEAEGLSARVGTNLEYGEYLELGTKDMAARPFLRSTLDLEQNKIGAMLSNGIEELLR